MNFNFWKKFNKEKGIAFIPVLIWGGIALVSAAAAWWGGKTALGQAVVDGVAYLLMGVADILYIISKFLCKTAVDIFDTALEIINNTSGKWGITGNNAFTSAWSSVRDFSNMFIVLGFIIVGIATTLRIRDYEAKKLLIPLIIMAILINFSGLFCGIIIDASNILTKGLLLQGGVSNMGSQYYDMVNKFTESVFAENTSLSGDPQKYLLANVTVSFIFLALAATFFYLSIILIIRYGILSILYVLSPLAFVCKIFPIKQAQSVWNQWWETFLKWSFIGVGAALVLNISASIMENIGSAGNEIISNPDTGYSMVVTKIDVTDILVVLLFLIIGFKMIKKASGIGAGGVMGLAAGAATFAVGGVGSITGLKGLAQRIGTGAKDKVTGASEKYLGKFSPVKRGTTAMNQSKRLEEPENRLNKIQDNQQLAKIAEQRAVTHDQQLDKAAAAKILAKRNAWNTIDPRKRDSVAAHATAFGVEKETFTKGKPETLTNVNDAEATAKVQHDAAQRYIARGGKAEDAYNWAKQRPVKQDEIRDAKAALEKRKITENALGLGPVSERDAKNRLIEKEEKQFIDAGYSRSEARELASKYVPKEIEITEMKQTLADEKIQKSFEKLDVGGIRSLPKDALSNIEFMKNVGSQRLGRAALEMSQDKVGEMKKAIPDMRAYVARELGIQGAATNAQIKAAYNAASQDIQKKVREMNEKISTLKRL